MNTIQTVPTAAASTTHPLILVAATAVTIASGVVIASFAGWLPKSEAPAPVAAASVAPVTTAAVTATPPNEVTPAVTAAPTAPPAPKVNPAPKPAKPVPVVQKVGTDETAPPPPPPRIYSAPPPPPRALAAQASSLSNVPPPGSAPAAYEVRSPVNTAGAPADYGQPPPPPPAPATCRDCGRVESILEVTADGKSSPVGAIAGAVVGGIIGNQFGSGSGRTATRLLGAAGGALIGNEVEKSNNKSARYDLTVRFEDGTARRFSSASLPGWRVGDRVKLQDGQLFPRN